MSNVFKACVAAGLPATDIRDLARIVSVAHSSDDVWAGCRVLRKCLETDLAPYLNGPKFDRFRDYRYADRICGLVELRYEAQEFLEAELVDTKVPRNVDGLTWEEWLAAAGPCSVMRGPPTVRREALELVMRAAWAAGEDPTEYRA